MGDRFVLALECAYCGELNREVWYAESSGVEDFECIKCGKANLIQIGFQAVKKNLTVEERA
jgi:Zn ribbon nucleic-acid-binding protein